MTVKEYCMLAKRPFRMNSYTRGGISIEDAFSCFIGGDQDSLIVSAFEGEGFDLTDWQREAIHIDIMCGRIPGAWIRDMTQRNKWLMVGRDIIVDPKGEIQPISYVVTDPPGPKKPIPAIPPEVWNPRKVDADKAMSAVRDMCRAQSLG